jgi:hypothetical protein
VWLSCLLSGVQETRIAKLLVSLKTRLAPYMAGEEEAFTEVQVRGAGKGVQQGGPAAAAYTTPHMFEAGP